MTNIDGVDIDLAITETFRSKITALTKGSFQFKNVLNLGWMNKQAIQRVYQTMSLVGRYPDLYDSQIGGQATWLYVNSKVGDHHFDNFTIEDTIHMHARPVLHSDYFSVTITMPLKIKTVSKLTKITESVTYNRVSQKLTAACHFRGAAIVTFYVVARFNTGEITTEEARTMYSRLIPEALEEFSKVERGENMKTVPTPVADVMEKYIFSKANTKLADEMAKRRTATQVISQDQLMLRKCDTTTGICAPVTSTKVKPAKSVTFNPVASVRPIRPNVTPNNVYSHIPRS